ncbi:uncharacterized protein LOC126769246 [Nymphalis io]|uniref:uncharacterized protein LOC126769246 n=1 Tax=Inachis io TaxID=171585 RepID=UPI0021696B0A|nr:uncharacterized protein LOC126769246 [Nymphalis io]
MPIEHSPPKTPTPMLQHSQSSPDITGDSNVTMRSQRLKRKRGDDLEYFLSKFENMFTTWTAAQDAKYESLLSTVNTIRDQNSQISSSIEFMSNKYDELKIKYDTLMQENLEDKAQIRNLEEKIEILERRSRATCIEIRNIPSLKTEKTQVLQDIVKSLGDVLKVEIDPYEIRNIHRGFSKNEKSKPLIVEFSSVIIKDKILSSAKRFTKDNNGDRLNTKHLSFDGPQKTVYVSDFFTPSMKRLYFLARDFAAKNKYKFCWATPGSILLRKKENEPSIRLKNEQDLKRLETT